MASGSKAAMKESHVTSILSFPADVLGRIFTLASRENGASELVHYSLVCKIFQAGVRQVTRLSLPRSGEEKYVEIVKMTPYAEEIFVLGLLHAKTLRQWSKVIGQTVTRLCFGSGNLQHLEALSLFPRLETLTIDIRLDLPEKKRLRNWSFPSVKRLVVILVHLVDVKQLQLFLDMFPNLECLHIWIYFLLPWTHSRVSFEHQNLKSLLFRGEMLPSVLVDCPKLTSLELCSLPGRELIIKSSNCLKSLSIEQVPNILEDPHLELPADFKGISHLTVKNNDAGDFIYTLFQKSVNTLETLVAGSMKLLPQIKEIVIRIKNTFKLQSLKALTVENLDDEWIILDNITREPTTLGNRRRRLNEQYLKLHEWLSSCPSLQEVSFCFSNTTIDAHYLSGFIKKARRLKKLFPNVTFSCP